MICPLTTGVGGPPGPALGVAPEVMLMGLAEACAPAAAPAGAEVSESNSMSNTSTEFGGIFGVGECIP